MRFEYKVEVWNDELYPASGRDFQNMLNDYGRSGWELVSITPQIKSDYSISDGPEHINCCEKVFVNCNVVVFKKSFD